MGGVSYSAYPKGAIIGAMVGHILLHLLALKAVKGMCTSSVDRCGSKARYADAVENFPASYFNVNPVHCLRSLYALNQKEAQEFYSPLKGWLGTEEVQLHMQDDLVDQAQTKK